MKINKTTIIIGILVLAATISLIGNKYWGWFSSSPSPSNFSECAANGNPIMESYPRQCRTPDGHTFVEQISPTPEPEPPIKESADKGCAVGGCSGEACTDASEGPAVTTCIYRAEYACYKKAKCERQTNGNCGWTQTADLKTCLASPPLQ